MRIVEPFAFLKVSALGIEERRTNVILDFVDPPGPLGDGYRVLARVIVWSSPSVLKIPISALFRCGERWCVFVAEGGRARRRAVDIGERNDQEAEVLSGVTQNEIVVRHPGNDLADGVRIAVRGLLIPESTLAAPEPENSGRLRVTVQSLAGRLGDLNRAFDGFAIGLIVIVESVNGLHGDHAVEDCCRDHFAAYPHSL